MQRIRAVREMEMGSELFTQAVRLVLVVVQLKSREKDQGTQDPCLVFSWMTEGRSIIYNGV